jgi:hypothetical protein
MKMRMNFTMITLADRPDLRTEFDAIQASAWSTFITHDAMGTRYWQQLLALLPQYQFGMLQSDGTLVAVGYCVPVQWAGDVRQLPDRGWDWALENGVNLAVQGGEATMLCALSISVMPAFRNQQLSYKMLAFMKALGKANGFSQLIAPVRPSLKKAYPITNILQYIQWVTEKGEPFDPWVRVHTRVGGKIVKLCKQSMVVNGTIAQWESWTGMRFPDSGSYVIPEGLEPLHINAQTQHGSYAETNVWIQHSDL